MLSVTDCKETEHGKEYKGKREVTKFGKTCRRWDSIAKLNPKYSSDVLYPDETITDAANYCRNPDGRSSGPWCFVTSTQQETCDIPYCKGKGNLNATR